MYEFRLSYHGVDNSFFPDVVPVYHIGPLAVGHDSPFPLERVEDAECAIFVLGTPIVWDKIGSCKIADQLLNIRNPLEYDFSTINGTFLIVIYQKAADRLIIVNDRFASFALFCLHAALSFYASVKYLDVWRLARKQPEFRINESALYEFIHLQKLLGDKTYDNQCFYLPAASVLVVENNDLTCRKYWYPDWKKEKGALDDFAYRLAQTIQRAIVRRTGDGKQWGLLLSGGLDSRTILAGFHLPVECFTVGGYENEEYQVAHELALARGSNHHFLQRSSDHYGNILHESVRLCGGMQVFDHAHFLGIGSHLKKKVDVVFHGHGMDYFFQGLYLPTERVYWLNRPTFIERLKNLTLDNLTTVYASSVKYRLKSVDPLMVVRDSCRQSVREAFMASLEEYAKRIIPHIRDPYEVWEQFHIGDLSRHYTYPNLLSMRTHIEERTVAFDNELLDLHFQMPVKYRLSGRVLRRALQFMDRDLASIRNANTGYPAYFSPHRATIYKAGRFLAKRIGLCNSRPNGKMGVETSRSWPDRAELLRRIDVLHKATHRLVQSEYLASISFLDMDRVKFYAEEHLAGRGNYASLLLTLITIDTFLRL